MTLYDDHRELVSPIIGDLNAALTDFVLDTLRAHGSEPRDVRRGDTYFIMQGLPNSVDSFRLSRVWPGWLFGLWVHGEYLIDESLDADKPVIQLFCQHESQIDKFKPSRSELLVELSRWEFASLLENCDTGPFTNEHWPMRAIAGLVDGIRQHPFLAYDGHEPLTGHPVASGLKGLARSAYKKRHDDLARRFWTHFAVWKGLKADKMREFDDFRVVYGGENRLPPVELCIWPEIGVSEEALCAAIDELFPATMEYGRHAFWGGEILHVEIPAGDGYYYCK